MIYPPSTPIASPRLPSTNPGRQLVDALARLTDLVAAIEADCATTAAPVALARHRAALYIAMDALGGWINAFLASGPPAAEIRAAKERITGLIRPWSATGPFFDHSFGKLRGYPSDFETIEIIYDCLPGGDRSLVRCAVKEPLRNLEVYQDRTGPDS